MRFIFKITFFRIRRVRRVLPTWLMLLSPTSSRMCSSFDNLLACSLFMWSYADSARDIVLSHLYIYIPCKVYAERFYNSHNDTTKNNNTIQIMAVIIIDSQKRNAFALGTNYAISIQMNKAIVNIKLYLAYNDLSKGNMKIETYPFPCNLMYT